MYKYFIGFFILLLIAAVPISSPTISPITTNAQLQGMSVSQTGVGTTITRLGFSQYGDSPPILYQATNSPCILNSGNGDNGSQVKSADSKCFIANLSGPLNVLIWGVVPNLDSSANLQAAVNYACTSASPGPLYIPPGTFKFHDIINPCGLLINGSGENSTVIDYTAAIAWAFLFQPPNWKTITRANQPIGAGISNLTLIANSGAGSPRAIEFDGSNGCTVDKVKLTGLGAYNGIKLYGTYKCSLTNITTGYFISPSNTFIELAGDTSGVCDPAFGGACTGPSFLCQPGNCSTRNDIAYIENVDSSGNFGDGILETDLVFSTSIHATKIENRNYGFRTQCSAGYPDISYCPQENVLVDFETEGAAIRPIQLIDSSSFKCVHCYALGLGDIVVNMDAGNYVGEGGFWWIGGRLFGATSACVFARRWTGVTIADSTIYDCNLNNIGQYAVSVGDFTTEVSLTGNIYCSYLGSTPSTMNGVGISANANKVNSTAPFYYGCFSGLNNFSSLPATVKEVNANGP